MDLDALTDRSRRPQVGARTPFLRAAAAVLSAGLLPASLPAAAPALAVAPSAPWPSSAQLIPLATLCAIGLTGIALVRGLRARSGDATARGDAVAAQQEIRAWWSEHRLGAAVVPLLAFASLPFAAGTVLTAVLLLTALVLLRLRNRLARAGLATQAEIGAMTGRSLEFLSLNALALVPLAGSMGQMPWLAVPLASQELTFAVPPLLLFGGLACHVLARHGRPFVARVCWMLVPVLAVAALEAGLALRRVEPALVETGWAAAVAAEPKRVDFGTIATFAQNLRTAGRLGPTDDELRSRVDAIDPTAFDFAANDALDLGLVDDRREATWLARVEGEVVTEGRLRYAVLVRSPAELLRFRLLARARRLDERTAAQMREAIVQAFAEPADDQTARGMLAAAAALRELGGDDEALRPRAQELLLALRSAAREREGLGFSRMRQRPGETLHPDSCAATWTAEAVRLALHFGVPDELDLAAVDRHLQRKRSPRHGVEPFQRYAAFAALAALRTMPGHVPQEPGPIDRLQRLTLAIAAVVLVAFAIAATLRARPVASQGAESLAAEGRS